jgi:Phosphofructokinase
MSTKRGVIGILTGGGDVPGLNPAIRAVTIRALREGFKVVGIRHGWLGAISILRDEHADNSEHFQILTEEIVNRAARTGGTFLHTSRTNPPAVNKEEVPEALRATYNQEKNDLTAEVIKNLRSTWTSTITRSASVHATPISKCSRCSSWRVIRKDSAGLSLNVRGGLAFSRDG